MVSPPPRGARLPPDTVAVVAAFDLKRPARTSRVLVPGEVTLGRLGRAAARVGLA